MDQNANVHRSFRQQKVIHAQSAIIIICDNITWAQNAGGRCKNKTNERWCGIGKKKGASGRYQKKKNEVLVICALLLTPLTVLNMYI